MDNLVLILLLSVGMFLLGWFTHSWVDRPKAEHPVGPGTTRWACGSCGRIKDLPSDLDTRVLVCNNCQIKLTRA